jgi:hypothetical protein
MALKACAVQRLLHIFNIATPVKGEQLVNYGWNTPEGSVI